MIYYLIDRGESQPDLVKEVLKARAALPKKGLFAGADHFDMNSIAANKLPICT